MDLTVKLEARKVLLIGIKLFFARLIIPRKYYNRFLIRQVKSISKDSFPVYAKDLVGTIKFSKKVSSNYKNTYTETDAVIQQFYIFKPYYLNVVAQVKAHRKRNNLPI